MSGESLAGFAVGLAISLAGLVVFGVVMRVLSDRSAAFVLEMREKQAETDAQSFASRKEGDDIAGAALNPLILDQRERPLRRSPCPRNQSACDESELGRYTARFPREAEQADRASARRDAPH